MGQTLVFYICKILNLKMSTLFFFNSKVLDNKQYKPTKLTHPLKINFTWFLPVLHMNTE